MSTYAAAINAHLGVTQPTPSHKPGAESREEYDGRIKAQVRARHIDLGRVIEGRAHGYGFTVRQFGATSFSTVAPGVCAWWSCYMTDEELLADVPGGDVEVRSQNCIKAIERAISGRLVWTGNWWERMDHLTGVKL